MALPSSKIAYFALVMVFVVLWSSSFAAAKFALQFSPPMLFLGVRFFLAGALMVGYAVAVGSYHPLALRDWGRLAVLGLLNQVGYQGVAWIAMGSVSSALAVVVISMNPIFITILAVPMLGEHLSTRRIAGLALGIIGVVVVLYSRITFSGDNVGGVLMMVVSLASMVVGSVLFKCWRIEAPLVVVVGGQFLSAGVLMFAIGALTEDWHAIVWGADLTWIMIYLIFAVSIGAVGLWFFLLSHGSASNASALHFLIPPFGLMFGWVLLGEHVTLGDLVGIVPIALGVWFATHKRAPRGHHGPGIFKKSFWVSGG